MKEMKENKQNLETNPYLEARREWSVRYGDYIVAAKNWRIAASGFMVLSVIMGVGLCISVAKEKVVPYIVEIDKLGAVSSSSVISPLKTIDTKVIKFTIAKFIEDSRSISSDRMVQKKALDNIYAYLPKTSSSLNYIQDYISGHNPFILAESKTIEVEITSILPISEKSWQVEWVETSRDLSANITGKTKWKGVLRVDFSPPESEKDIIANPLGLFITNLSWAQQL